MMKHTIELEYVADGKIYRFTCDNNSPIGHSKDALNKFIQYVCQIEDNILTQQKEAEEKNKIAENEQKTE